MPLVLMYHDVVDADDDASGFPGGAAASYKLPRADFVAHLDAIVRSAKCPTAVVTGPNPLPANAAPLVLTFDDGGVSAATIIAGELEKRSWRGQFFVTADFIGKHGFVDRDQIRDLVRRGHAIGSHSCSHPTRMAMCSREQLLDEWRRSRDVLSEIVGESVTTASVPGGYYSRPVAETAAQAGFLHLFNSEPTTAVKVVDGCQIIGRYAVTRTTSASNAAALAAGSGLWKQAAAWKVKKVLKAIGGPTYLRVRRLLLDRKYQKPV